MTIDFVPRGGVEPPFVPKHLIPWQPYPCGRPAAACSRRRAAGGWSRRALRLSSLHPSCRQFLFLFPFHVFHGCFSTGSFLVQLNYLV